MDYSEVKLYIPKGADGRPTVEKPWYVYFYYRNPETGKIDSNSKFIFKDNINRKYRTVSERREFGRKLVQVYTKLLEDGYDPYTKSMPDRPLADFSTVDVAFEVAFNKALEEKKATWSKGSASSNSTVFKRFRQFADRHRLSAVPSHKIGRRHVSEFLKQLTRKGLNPKTVNNYRAELSSVFSQMVENGHMEANPCTGIRKLRENPVKNHPFTREQLERIRTELGEDSKLLRFMRVMAYSFLRNSEVLRLRVRDIDMDNRMLTARGTKTSRVEKVFIIDQLYGVLEGMGLERYDGDHFLFSRDGMPGPWEANLRTKKKVYSDIFRDLSKKMNLGPEYSIYSVRHSAAYELYRSFQEQGLSEYEIKARMLPITRHRSITALENYLRGLVRMMPKDYGDRMDFGL